MKILLKLLTVLTISLTSNAVLSECEGKKELLYQKEVVSLCHSSKNNLLVSEKCIGALKKCFLKKKIKLMFQPNQSPGFSLCYQLDGHPFFGFIKGQKEKTPMCLIDGNYVDQENLLLAYKAEKP